MEVTRQKLCSNGCRQVVEECSFQNNGLDGILPAEAVKTLPDHDDIGVEKPRSELSGGVRDPDALRCSLMSRRPNPVCSLTEDRIEAGVADFAAALEACVPASHRSPHPFVRDFVIEHEISGLDGESCGYSQTMPGNMHMACKLDQPGRVGLAAEFRELAEGRMSGGTGEQPGWTSGCEVVTADGKRMKLKQD